MFISWTLIMPSFKTSLIVEQFQGNYLKLTWSKKKRNRCVKLPFTLEEFKNLLVLKDFFPYLGSSVKTAIKSYGNTDYWVTSPGEGGAPLA